MNYCDDGAYRTGVATVLWITAASIIANIHYIVTRSLWVATVAFFSASLLGYVVHNIAERKRDS